MMRAQLKNVSTATDDSVCDLSHRRLQRVEVCMETAARRARRILVVDDNKDTAESLKIILELAGHTTWSAYDGVAALELAQRLVPDVVVLDIAMPGMNGHEVARRIRSTPELGSVFLVAVTGLGTSADRKASYNAGFDIHLSKPVDPELLVAGLR
jgi:CheY-like chemotaxis protein